MKRKKKRFLEKSSLQGKRNIKLIMFNATKVLYKKNPVTVRRHAYIQITEWLNTVVGSYVTNKDALNF